MIKVKTVDGGGMDLTESAGGVAQTQETQARLYLSHHR